MLECVCCSSAELMNTCVIVTLGAELMNKCIVMTLGAELMNII